MKLYSAALLLSLFITYSPLSTAEIFKCKTLQGKTIYSESPCEGAPSERLEVIDNTLDSSRLRREARRSRTSEGAQYITSQAKPQALMSDHDKQKRIDENIISSKALTATSEKRGDAQYENNILRKARVKALSFEDNLKRSNLKVDLDNMNRAKRRKAATELMSLYTKY